MNPRIITLALAASALTFFHPFALPARTLNPAYLSEMPDPARVTAGVKGKDAEDTGEREMGAFISLIQIMDDMAWGLEHRYVNNADTRKLTPDERRIRLAYQTAYAELWKKVTNKEGHVYDHDRDLRNELLTKFFSENFRSLYFKSNANAAAGYKAFREKMYGNPAAAPPAQTQTAQPGGGPGSNSETMRCIASGRAKRICLSEGMSGGFGQLIGVSLKTPVPSGLRMTGDYSGPDGFRLIFEPEAVTMVCRGVPEPTPYSVQINGTQALLKLQNGPVLSLRSDGTLAGSGPIKVTGEVPSGSHSEQTMGTTTQRTTTTRELTPLEAQGYPADQRNAMRNGQTYTLHEDATQLVYGSTGTRNVIDYTTKTTNCTVGLLNPTGPSPLPLLKNDFDILTAIGTGVGAMLNGHSVQDAGKEMLEGGPTVPPGLRVNGRYAGEGGFSLTFHRESVTLGCGEAEQALDYSVRHSGNNTLLVIKDTPNPISLQLLPDGSIAGEGTVQVNGRVITGTRQDMNDPFVFAPRVASCPVGRLLPGDSAPRPAVASTASAGSSTPAPAAGTSLRIAAGPGVANLLAGKTMMVLKEDLESILAKAGITAAAPASRISTWTHACERSPRDPICQQGMTGLRTYLVARATFDQNGIAAFNNIPTLGAFYVVADTAYSHHLLWNVRVDLKPGANSVSLDEQNSAHIER
ncbi:MAG TPA: hypothetical protein VGL72_17165 [Bryobacteraceae bacterium]|jgi:hypothetical protein